MNNFNPKWMILYEDELKTAKNIFQELWNKVSPCFMSVKGSAPFKQEKNPNGDIDICYFFPANSKMGKIQDILKKYGLDKHLKVGQINGHSIISCKGAQLEGAQLDVSCYTSPTLPLLNNYSASSGTSNPTSWQESKKTERNPTLHFLYVGNDSFLPYENRNIYSHIQELQKKIAIQENKYQESPIKSRFLKADEYSKINSSYEEARRIIESLDRNRRQRPQIQRSFSKSNLQNEVTTTPPSIFALDAENNESEYTGNKRVG